MPKMWRLLSVPAPRRSSWDPRILYPQEWTPSPPRCRALSCPPPRSVPLPRASPSRRPSTRPTPSIPCSSSTSRRGAPVSSWRPAAGSHRDSSTCSPDMPPTRSTRSTRSTLRGRARPVRHRRRLARRTSSEPGARVVSRSDRRPRVRTRDGGRRAPGQRLPGRPPGDGASRRASQPAARVAGPARARRGMGIDSRRGVGMAGPDARVDGLRSDRPHRDRSRHRPGRDDRPPRRYRTGSCRPQRAILGRARPRGAGRAGAVPRRAGTTGSEGGSLRRRGGRVKWPFVGTMRLRRRRVVAPGGTVVVFVVSVLAMLYVDRMGRKFGCGFGLSAPLWARRSIEEGTAVEEQRETERVTGQVGRMIGFISGAEQVSRALERAASGEGAVGPTTTLGDRAVIPLLETFASGGFGGGAGGDVQGDGGGGGGGGGIGRSRTVAVAVVGPDGVKIRPVVDLTGLALPPASAVAALLMRGAGRRRRLRRR